MLIKLPKRPEEIFSNRTVLKCFLCAEILEELEVLPVNAVVYYILRTFADKMNNGGLVQYYLETNPSNYRYLYRCGNQLKHPAFTPFLEKVGRYCVYQAELRSDNDAEQTELDKSFEKEFYELDKKYNFEKVLKEYYKANYTGEKIDVSQFKAPESETCRYFIFPENHICLDAQQAAESYLKVLADFSEQRWTIELFNYFDTYRIIATAFGKAIDLQAVFQYWDDPAISFSGDPSDLYDKRMKLTSYFNGIQIISGTDGISLQQVSVTPSGFVQHEMQVEYDTRIVGTEYDQEVSRILFYDRSHIKDGDKYNIFKAYLEEHYKEYENIEMVFES